MASAGLTDADYARIDDSLGEHHIRGIISNLMAMNCEPKDAWNNLQALHLETRRVFISYKLPTTRSKSVQPKQQIPIRRKTSAVK